MWQIVNDICDMFQHILFGHRKQTSVAHDSFILIIMIIKPYLSAHTQLSPYAQQIQTTIYNEKQYETNITKLIRNIKKFLKMS